MGKESWLHMHLFLTNTMTWNNLALGTRADKEIPHAGLLLSLDLWILILLYPSKMSCLQSSHNTNTVHINIIRGTPQTQYIYIIFLVGLTLYIYIYIVKV